MPKHIGINVGHPTLKERDMELILKVDEKGRVLIPAKIRKALGVRRAVKLYVEKGKIILEPIADPLEELAATVIKGTRDVESEIAELRRIAEKKAVEEVKRRWRS